MTVPGDENEPFPSLHLFHFAPLCLFPGFFSSDLKLPCPCWTCYFHPAHGGGKAEEALLLLFSSCLQCLNGVSSAVAFFSSHLFCVLKKLKVEMGQKISCKQR